MLYPTSIIRSRSAMKSMRFLSPQTEIPNLPFALRIRYASFRAFSGWVVMWNTKLLK